MFFDLPQLVPQKICLSCQGCCRFKEASSLWRPKVAAAEIAQISSENNKRALTRTVLKDGYVATVGGQDQHRCTFLNLSNNKCGIYACRPFECRLYPFLLTKNNGSIAVSVHLNCPYVQESRHSVELERHAAVLKAYLSREGTLRFLKNNPELMGDYGAYSGEIEELFTFQEERLPCAALLERKEVVEHYLRQTPKQLSSFSFVNIFAWQEFFQFDFEVMDGNLCVFARHDPGTFLYLPPLGKKMSAKTIRACFERMEKINPSTIPAINRGAWLRVDSERRLGAVERVNRGSGVSRIENVQMHQLKFFPPDEFAYYSKGYEYCYYREDIAALRGNPYKSKRSSYNHFVKSYAFEYLPYEDSMREECAALYENWARGRRRVYADNAVYVQMLEENARVHRLVIRHYRDLGLVGRVVAIDGKIMAYSFGYPLNRDIFCILFEIADLSFNGLAVFLFREFCRDAAVAPYKFVNVMDDFELERIRQTKMSFHPVLLFPSYIVRPLIEKQQHRPRSFVSRFADRQTEKQRGLIISLL